MDTANVTRQFNGKFNTYPPKKVYYGKGNMSGEVVMVAGFCAFLFSFQQLVAADYMHNSYCMSSSHFNMDNIIVVDGKYRWIPTKMKPPQHGDEAGYSYQEQEQDWTPTDGKGI